MNGDRGWLCLDIPASHEMHVLPVETVGGAERVAPGHSVSSLCRCGAIIETDAMGGVRLVSHEEPSWPGSDKPKVLVQ